MNNLVPFVRPTFYTPKNLAPTNSLTNLTTKPATNQNYLRQLTPNYGQSPGDTPSTGGDPNQGTMNVGDMTAAQQMQGIDQADAIGKSLSVSPFSLSPVSEAIGVGRGMLSAGLALGMNQEGMNASEAASQQAAQAENEAMGLSPAEAEAASQGIDVGKGMGTAAGSGASGPGDKIICDELYRQGLMPKHIWKADEKFGAQLDIEALVGYWAWAWPWVRIMRSSPILTRLTWLVARPWAHHMAFQMGVEPKDNAIGRGLMKIGLKVCRAIGSRRLSRQTAG